jgi:hypothetical protein
MLAMNKYLDLIGIEPFFLSCGACTIGRESAAARIADQAGELELLTEATLLNVIASCSSGL